MNLVYCQYSNKGLQIWRPSDLGNFHSFVEAHGKMHVGQKSVDGKFI